MLTEQGAGKLTGMIDAHVKGKPCPHGPTVQGDRIQCVFALFTPAAGAGGRRAITATVTRAGGTSLGAFPVTTYVAPATRVPSAASVVRLVRLHYGHAILSWRRAPSATTQYVSLRLSNGVTRGIETTSCTRVRLTGVPARVGVSVSLYGGNVLSEFGPTVRARLAPARRLPPNRRPPSRCESVHLPAP